MYIHVYVQSNIHVHVYDYIILFLDSKLDAVQLLLHTFTSAATFLNPQATRCSCLYSMEFDSSGSLTAASVRVSVLIRVMGRRAKSKVCMLKIV